MAMSPSNFVKSFAIDIYNYLIYFYHYIGNLTTNLIYFYHYIGNFDRRDGIVVRASTLQSVDLGFIPLVESYQKTLKNGIYSFPAWRSAFMGGCGEQAGKFACCVLGQGT